MKHKIIIRIKTLIVICLFTHGLYTMNNHTDYSIFNHPWLIAQVYNDSNELFFMSGYDQDQHLQADILNPEQHIDFWVRDEKSVKIASPTGIYSIYLTFYFDKNGQPKNTHAIFEKLQAEKVSNKIGPGIVFSKNVAIAPFGQRLTFRILLDNTVVLITDKEVTSGQTPFDPPLDEFRPPFSS
ncbi:hypothetical protein BH09DEP1_BH09DEP1_2580 [soil metagenome]